VAGWTSSVILSAITSSGGILTVRLLRSRWIARVCRTVLFFLAFLTVVLAPMFFVMTQFYRIMDLTDSRNP
jgi:hypothetical protein